MRRIFTPPKEVQEKLDAIRERLRAEGYTGTVSHHPEYRVIYKKWQWEHCGGKEAQKVRRKKFYAENRLQIIARQKAYADSHVEELKEYRRKNAARRHETSQKWRKANWERYRKTRKAWEERSRHIIRAHIALRRAREINATIGDPREIVAWEKAWKALPSNTCEWCRMDTPTEYCCSDHAEPLTRGGPHNLSNLVIACRDCNQRKKNKPLSIWLDQLEKRMAEPKLDAKKCRAFPLAK